jgi:hypothetical protein
LLTVLDSGFIVPIQRCRIVTQLGGNFGALDGRRVERGAIGGGAGWIDRPNSRNSIKLPGFRDFHRSADDLPSGSIGIEIRWHNHQVSKLSGIVGTLTEVTPHKSRRLFKTTCFIVFVS